MTLEEFYDEFRKLHKLRPFKLSSGANLSGRIKPYKIRQIGSECCPLAALANNKVGKKQFNNFTVDLAAKELGLDYSDAKMIVLASDQFNPLSVNFYYQTVRDRLLEIINEK